jgi:hypothetical protein
MLSTKIFCDGLFSSKVPCISIQSRVHIYFFQSWAIIGQGFYEMSDINLMEREMIKHLAWDLGLALPPPMLDRFTAIIQKHYRKGTPKRKFQPILFTPPPTMNEDVSSKTTMLASDDKSMHALPGICIPEPPRVLPSFESPDPGLSSMSSPGSSCRKSSPPSPRLNTPSDMPDMAGLGQGQTYPAACNNISSQPGLIDSFIGGVVVV